jgi:5-methyltetrahydropteroyltriglutamate--homocysteine methyltransferase
MTSRHVRADNLGSLLRPPAVRAAYDDGSSSAERRAIEDAAIEEAITHQERVGLPVITDGEFRRRHFFSTLLEVTEGLDPEGYVRRHRDEAGTWQEVRTPAPVRRLERTSTMAEAELAFVRDRTSRQVKITLPAPSLLACYWSEAVSGGAYPTRDEYLDHLVELTAEDVRALAAAGADHIQLDAPHYCYLNIIRPDLDDPDAALTEMVRHDQEVFAGVDAVASAIHVCRGNNRSRFVGTDPYDAFAPALFPELTVDRVLLEYERFGRIGGHGRPQTRSHGRAEEPQRRVALRLRAGPANTLPPNRRWDNSNQPEPLLTTSGLDSLEWRSASASRARSAGVACACFASASRSLRGVRPSSRLNRTS